MILSQQRRNLARGHRQKVSGLFHLTGNSIFRIVHPAKKQVLIKGIPARSADGLFMSPGEDPGSALFTGPAAILEEEVR
jgi:hypothetical protein